MALHCRILLLGAIVYIFFAALAAATINNISIGNEAGSGCLAQTPQLSGIQLYQLSKANWWKRLKSSHYDSYTPPNYPNTTNVRVSIWPFGISRVDEVSQTIKINTLITLSWLDERLTFDSNTTTDGCLFPYQGMFTLVDSDNEQEQADAKIWQARLRLERRQDEITKPFLKITRLAVDAAGEVVLQAFSQESRLCNIQTKRYPFDKQVCTIRLTVTQNVSLHHDRDFDLSRAAMNKIRMEEPENYETNEWKLFENDDQFFSSVRMPKYETNTGFGSSIEYKIHFNRKYIQHVINWIASPIALSVSSVIGMYRGCEVGERFSFGGTIVVTITLMVNELHSVIGVSEDYPILGRMYIGLEITLILATLFSSLPRRVGKLLDVARKQRLRKSVQKSVIVAQRSAVPFTNDDAPEQSLSPSWQDKLTNYCFVAVQNWTEVELDWAVLVVVITLQASVILYCVVMWLA